MNNGILTMRLVREVDGQRLVASVDISESSLDRLSHGEAGEILNLKLIDLKNLMQERESQCPS